MISVGVIQTRLGITDDAAHLAQLESEVAADVATWTGLYLGIVNRTFEDVRDGTGLARRRLTAPEVETLPSVGIGQPLSALGEFTSIDHRTAPDQVWEAYDLTDSDTGVPLFEVDGNRLVKLRGDWPEGRKVVRLKYDFFWAEDAAPADVTGVLLDEIVRRYERPELRKIAASVTSVVVRGVQVRIDRTNGAQMPDGLRRRLAQLRRHTSFGGGRRR